jgi:hypothetical protein
MTDTTEKISRSLGIGVVDDGEIEIIPFVIKLNNYVNYFGVNIHRIHLLLL